MAAEGQRMSLVYLTVAHQFNEQVNHKDDFGSCQLGQFLADSFNICVVNCLLLGGHRVASCRALCLLDVFAPTLGKVLHVPIVFGPVEIQNSFSSMRPIDG